MRQIGTTGNLRMVRIPNLPVEQLVCAQFASGASTRHEVVADFSALGIEADMAGLVAASTRAQMTRKRHCVPILIGLSRLLKARGT